MSWFDKFVLNMALGGWIPVMAILVIITLASLAFGIYELVKH